MVIKIEKIKPTIALTSVCIYIFILTERPWESIGILRDIPIQLPYAIVMILVVFFSGAFSIVRSSTNKWLYSLLALHFILIPFSFNSEFTLDQNYEYAKSVLLYMFMLAVVKDEFSLQILIKAFVYSMMFYMVHSLWEYSNGRHVYRMGIARMIGVDATHNDPNSFGASVVLSLPFVYALLRSEVNSFKQKLYLMYFAIAVLCVILTGSRSAAVALVFLLLSWGLAQKGGKKIVVIVTVVLSLGVVWTVMPDDKRERIQTLWDEDAGPENAHDSARGRLVGWQVSWEMFKQKPFTGVGPGGKNFIEYRMAHNIDGILDLAPSPSQSHNLYGQVLAEFGLPGAILFVGLIFSTWKNSANVLQRFRSLPSEEHRFLRSLCSAIVITLLLLLLLGLGGHNFYRPLWLWLAAWSGSVALIAETKLEHSAKGTPSSFGVPMPLS